MATGRVIALEEHFMHETLARHLGAAAHPAKPIAERLYDLAGLRLDEMDKAGIDVQGLSHQSPGSQRLGDDVAVEACRAVNDALAAIIREMPDRFAGFAMIPTMLPEAAADELQRAVEELGLKGAMIHGPSRGRFVDTPGFWPIYARAAALGVPVYLHPAMPDRTVSDIYYAPYADAFAALPMAAWGLGVEAGTQAVRLVLSSVLERYPDLKVLLGHMGEAIPFLLPRIDEALSRPGNAPVAFAEAFRRNFHITTSGFFSDTALACCLEVMGPERVLFAVDWPYADNEAATAWLAAAPVDARVRGMIAHGNAEALLGL